jgi:hypothetical protein
VRTPAVGRSHLGDSERPAVGAPAHAFVAKHKPGLPVSGRSSTAGSTRDHKPVRCGLPLAGYRRLASRASTRSWRPVSRWCQPYGWVLANAGGSGRSSGANQASVDRRQRPCVERNAGQRRRIACCPAKSRTQGRCDLRRSRPGRGRRSSRWLGSVRIAGVSAKTIRTGLTDIGPPASAARRVKQARVSLTDPLRDVVRGKRWRSLLEQTASGVGGWTVPDRRARAYAEPGARRSRAALLRRPERW